MVFSTCDFQPDHQKLKHKQTFLTFSKKLHLPKWLIDGHVVCKPGYAKAMPESGSLSYSQVHLMFFRRDPPKFCHPLFFCYFIFSSRLKWKRRKAKNGCEKEVVDFCYNEWMKKRTIIICTRSSTVHKFWNTYHVKKTSNSWT
jgi:hypothetical protein